MATSNGVSNTMDSIEAFKQNDGIGLTVSADEDGSVSFGVAVDDPSQPSPPPDVFERLTAVYGDLAKELTSILTSREPEPDRAHAFGKTVMETCSRDPRISEDSVFDVIQFDTITAETANQYVDFAELYPNQGYPDNVDVETAARVAQHTTETHAKTVVKTLSEHDDWPDSPVLDAWETIDDLTLTEVIDAVINTNADNPLEATQYVYVLNHENPPDKTDIQTALETARESNTHSTDESVLQMETVDEDTQSFENDYIGDIAAEIIEDIDVNDTDAVVSAFATALTDAAQQYDGLDKYWMIGTISRAAKREFNVNYSTLCDATGSIPVQTAKKARVLTHMYDYDDYPNIGLETLYLVYCACDSYDDAVNAITRALTGDRKLTQRVVKLWDATDVQDDQALRAAIEESNIPDPDGTIEVIKLLEGNNNDVPTGNMDVGDVISLAKTGALPEGSLTEEQIESLAPDVFETIHDQYSGLDEGWLTGTIMTWIRDETSHTYTDMMDNDWLHISKSKALQGRKLTTLYDYQEYPDNITLLSANEATVECSTIDEARSVLDRAGQHDIKLNRYLTEAWRDINQVTVDEIARVIDEHDRITNPGQAADMLITMTRADATRNDVVTALGEPNSPTDEPTTTRDTAANPPIETLLQPADTDDYTAHVIENATVNLSEQTVSLTDPERQELTQTYSPSLPSRNIVEFLTQFDSLVQLNPRTTYWSELLTDNNIDLTVIDTNATPDDHHATPYTVEHSGVAVTEYTDQPLFIEWPADDLDSVLMPLLTYESRGGDTVLFLGEGPGGDTVPVDFFEKLTADYQYVTSIVPVQWASQSDALHVYTKTGDLPTGTTIPDVQLMEGN